MATETATATSEVSTEAGNWKAGVASGLVGSVVFGLVMTYVIPAPLLEVVIPSMYGLAPPAAPFLGWVVHMSHGAVIGVGFAALVGVRPSIGESTGASLGAGAAYGLAVWVALAVLVMPVWLSAVGSPANPPLPNVSALSAIGHLVYGVALGGAYAGLVD
ncbi:histidine kinase [Halorubrum sp. Ib24]|uniref:histidine kinase n=1 Tax=unclassified Halorubrum TaxID=2642239 RepID=UPI000B986021|nr:MULTISPECIES: histidine kinase [unclassified Halorubrum]OYR42767.1 histidine kinase [Halorubrum sp. Ib24]OYR43690.1 histidine kinase [Halorubrum sp. Hd13]OYR47754.1 histidine kinase [Halorubrum sp. Eb13]OYR48191.1 histidine kinase [Halorubrum sp. Ea8]OYR49019.1 histidine kinase [Halorubrum sp. Ea1]